MFLNSLLLHILRQEYVNFFSHFPLAFLVLPHQDPANIFFFFFNFILEPPVSATVVPHISCQVSSP